MIRWFESDILNLKILNKNADLVFACHKKVIMRLRVVYYHHEQAY